jgi:hypothetical protein
MTNRNLSDYLSANYSGYTGSIGFTGSKGDSGYVGSASSGFTGSAGYTGSQGSLGYTGSGGGLGYTGSQGIPGAAGGEGSLGYTGSIGYTGSQGAGFTGSAGDLGYTGSIGYTGSVPSAPYDLVVWQQGKPAAGQVLLRVKVPRDVSYLSNWVGSTSSPTDYAATSTAVFSIQKNGSQVGTATYSAGASTPAFASSGAQTFLSGDILSVVAPSPQDATLEGISIVLVGTR